MSSLLPSTKCRHFRGRLSLMKPLRGRQYPILLRGRRSFLTALLLRHNLRLLRGRQYLSKASQMDSLMPRRLCLSLTNVHPSFGATPREIGSVPHAMISTDTQLLGPTAEQWLELSFSPKVAYTTIDTF